MQQSSIQNELGNEYLMIPFALSLLLIRLAFEPSTVNPADIDLGYWNMFITSNINSMKTVWLSFKCSGI